MSLLMPRRLTASPSFALLLAVAAGCAESTPIVPTDAGGDPPDAATPTDAGSAVDAGTDAGAQPACLVDDDCSDGDDCTSDGCDPTDGGVCIHDNPLADCDRFDGIACAGELATSLLTIDQSFCIPGFAIDVPTGDPDAGMETISISLCQGQKCDPADAEDGCLVTLTSEGEPASSPDPATLHIAGRVTGVEGTVPFSGVIPNPGGGGGTIPLNCNISIEVGSGLPLAADLALTEVLACGTDRTVDATVDVDLSDLDVKLTGMTFLDLLACVAADAAISSQLSTLLGTVEPQLESALDQALSSLDCGTCGADCPADLICRLPVP